MRILALAAVLIVAQTARAAEPLEMPHPETGESGVWIPNYVQRYHLRVESELKACREDGTFVLRQHDALNAALGERSQEAEDLQRALDSMARGLAYDMEYDKRTEVKLRRRTRWAVGSTIAGAIIALFFGAYAAGQ